MTDKTPIADRISAALVNRRYWFAFGFALLFLLLLPGLRNLGYDAHYKIFVNADNPYLQELERIDTTYQAAEDSMAFLLVAPEGKDLFTHQGLTLLRDLTRASLEMTDAFDAESISTFQRIQVDDDLLSGGNLIPDMGPFDPAEIRALALTNDALVGRLVSQDGTLAVVVTTFSISQDRSDALLVMQSQADAIRNRLLEQAPSYRIMLSGLLMFDYAMVEAVIKDVKLIVPLVGLFVLAFLWLVFRSLVCSVLTILTVITNVVVTCALLGYFHVALNVMTVSGIITIATLSVADSIHLLTAFLANIKTGQDKLQAMLQALRLNLVPIFLTSLTTFIGFMALFFSPSPPVQQLGLFIAAGVVFDFLTTVLLLPALVLLFSGYRGLSESAFRYPAYIARLATKHSLGKVLVGSAVCILIGLFALRNDINDDSLKWFSKKLEFRQSVDISSGKLQGFKNITFNLDAKDENGTLDPEFMGLVDAFSVWLLAQPEVDHVYSYLDMLKQARQAANQNNPDFYDLPETRQEAAQLLLLREISAPSSRSLNALLSISKRQTRVVLSLQNIDNKKFLAFEEKARAWLLEQRAGVVRTGSSVPLMFAQIMQDNLYSMMVAAGFVMVAILLVVSAAFRSLRYGLLAIIPNALPLMLIYGIWGILFGTLDMAAVTTFAVALGIIVDDTIHILTKYIAARRDGKMPEEAIGYSMNKSAIALTTTTVVLAGCFLLQSLSYFQLSATQGLMVALTLVFALVLDLFYFPAVLLVADKIRPSKAGRHVACGILALILGSALLVPTGPVWADAQSQAKGLAVVEAMNKHYKGYGTAVSSGTMTLQDAGGRSTVRRFTAASKEGRRGVNTILLEFQHPADIAGTKLLTKGSQNRGDQQWIYLPSLNKLRRISGGSARNSFLGSEFTYEDLTSSSIDKYTYDHLGTEKCSQTASRTCDLVQRIAKTAGQSAYARSVMWVSRDRFLVYRVDYYAANGRMIKSFYVTKFIQVNGKYWRIARSRMVNNISGRITRMDWSNFKLGASLPAGTFDPDNLGE